MKASSSCKESMKNCMENHSFAFAHLYNDEKAMDMHIHDCYEIYYSISGGKQFLIDNCFYDIQNGDLFLINQFESHYLSQIDMQKHERIIVSIDPDYLKQISTPATDLDRCFHFRETEMPHRLHLSAEEQRRFLYYIHRFPDNTGLGEDVLDHADVILAKGQGNYESLYGQGRHVFYSFLCKCDLFTGRFQVPKLTGIFREEWD